LNLVANKSSPIIISDGNKRLKLIKVRVIA
jgi:hypothetical protein